MSIPHHTLQDIIYAAAARPKCGLWVHSPGKVQQRRFVSYRVLLHKAHWNAYVLQTCFQLPQGSPILIHFQDHIDNVVWFWSTVLAGYVPAMTGPFAIDIMQRERHIEHISTLLDNPPWITRQQLVSSFETHSHKLSIYTIEQLEDVTDRSGFRTFSPPDIEPQALAALVFTSGSTGLSKAVCLSHDQIITAIQGKVAGLRLGATDRDVLLNWVGLDHVAGLVENHIAAIYLGANQVLVQAADLLSMPILFPRLLSQYKVTFSFAPNFFLVKILTALENHKDEASCFDFSTLRCIASGGEANVVTTCNSVNKMFRLFGALSNVVVPGFGMSETCAGAIFNRAESDGQLSHGGPFASVGICNPGIEMRITSLRVPGQVVAAGEIGQLEIRGPVIFKQYYNDIKATKTAFTEDGWFVTGDQGFICLTEGTRVPSLTLCGRLTDLLNINGVKYAPEQVEDSIISKRLSTVTPDYILAFAYRPPNSSTESVCIVYLPTYDVSDWRARRETNQAISQAVLQAIQTWPYVLPLDKIALQKSTLGKLSRAKVKKAFENGEYSWYQQLNNEALSLSSSSETDSCGEPTSLLPKNALESIILDECRLNFGDLGCELDVETNLYQVGVSSVDLLRLKVCLQRLLEVEDIPMVTIITNPSVRLLATALSDLRKPHTYDPVVVLQSEGDKTPLWLIHPGVGEVLIFLVLARYFTDRPVYALRARGFEGEGYFGSVAEAVEVYGKAIKDRQPRGPYAIAGYSYGSMFAFEISKMLTQQYGDEIRFLGSFNLPPHIKSRMKQLDWTEGLLNLAYFLELFSAETAQTLSPELHLLPSRDQVVKNVVRQADAQRLSALGLNSQRLSNWADLAFSLQSIARGYEPSGKVQGIDVFCAHPLAAVSRSREEWMENHLSKWADFSESAPRFHHVKGEHYTMISPENAASFQMTLKDALRERGL